MQIFQKKQLNDIVTSNAITIFKFEKIYNNFFVSTNTKLHF